MGTFFSVIQYLRNFIQNLIPGGEMTQALYAHMNNKKKKNLMPQKCISLKDLMYFPLWYTDKHIDLNPHSAQSQEVSRPT
jgi:hypothetical protein